jgi:hypothetical protein
MSFRVVAVALVSHCALGTAGASSLSTANSSPNTPLVLTSGQLIVNDALDGNVGRPSTLLGEYDPAYHTLITSNQNGSPLGNGQASQLVGVPLRPNGSAYFRVTGAGDTQFNGTQTQLGRYSYQFNLFDAHHNLVTALPAQYDSVIPGMIDNVWLDPNSDPRLVGGTVDMTLNNIVGPGTGDSRDFFVFTGLQPGQAFTARLDFAAFHGLVGLFDNAHNLTVESNPADSTGTVTGHADQNGRVLIGVTGAPDTQFIGQHAETGAYTLEVIPVNVPEPTAGLLLGLGGLIAGLGYARRHRRRRRVPMTRAD